MKRIKMAVIFPLLIAGGILLFCLFVNRLRDVECISDDKTAKLILEKVTNKDEVRMGAYEYGFYPQNVENFYEDYIENNPSYVYAVDADNHKTKAETGTYILSVNQRYFFIKRDEWNTAMFTYRELGNIRIYINGGDRLNGWGGFVITPLRTEDELPKIDGENGEELSFYAWNETFGLSSYEDLADFYKRTGEGMYTLMEEDKTVLVAAYVYGKWHPDVLELKVREDNSGFDVRLLRYVKEEKIQYDQR